MRILTQGFGTPTNQQRGFASTDAAVFSAATYLAARMALKMRTATTLVRRWYAAGAA